MACMRTYCLVTVLLSVVFALAATDALPQIMAGSKPPGASPASLVYREQGVEFEVTAEGLSAIRVGGRTLASGGWNVFNAEPWFKDAGTGAVKTGPAERKTLEVLGPQQARVTQAGGQVVSTIDYTFDGEDVTISARVENHHPQEPINVVGFSGLSFDFDRPPEGLVQVQHISYFQAHGLGLCHPSFWSKIGGSYAFDGTIGVGVSPWKTGWTRTLILWDYGSWEPDAAGETASAAAALLRRRAGSRPRRADDRPAAPRQPQPGLATPAGPVPRTFSGHVRPGPLRRRLPLDRLGLHEPQPAGRLTDESLWIPRRASPSRSGRGRGCLLPDVDPGTEIPRRPGGDPLGPGRRRSPRCDVPARLRHPAAGGRGELAGPGQAISPGGASARRDRPTGRSGPAAGLEAGPGDSHQRRRSGPPRDALAAVPAA